MYIFFKTLSRLWLSIMMLPYFLLRTGKIIFVHPFTRISGKVEFESFVEISFGAVVKAGVNGIKIGKYSQINENTVLTGNITIGQRVLIAPQSVLAVGGHRFGKGVQPRFSGGLKEVEMIIGDDVWIGAGVILVGNISIGRGSVIAAGIVLDTSIEEETLVRRSKTGGYILEPIK